MELTVENDESDIESCDEFESNWINEIEEENEKHLMIFL